MQQYTAIVALNVVLARDERDLVTLSPKNYPLGLKDIVYGGDFPVGRFQGSGR